MEVVVALAPVLATFFGKLVMRGVDMYKQYHANRADRPGRRPDDRPRLPAPKITNEITSFSQQLVVRRAAPQQLAVRNALPQQLAHNASKHNFGGVIIVTPKQQARDTHKDKSKYGVNTGSRPSKWANKDSAEAHWKSLKSSDSGVNTANNARAVAVVNFTKFSVTMFVEDSKQKTYYRSYKVKSCPDIAGFVLKYRQREVFSGETVGGKLVRCNHDMTQVEDDGENVVKSTNCWKKLGVSAAGIKTEVKRDPIFVQMVRGAVFGLICCVHKNKPSSMNVNMRSMDNGQAFVHVDTDVGVKLERGRDCCFSVFRIGKPRHEWVKEKVLVG